MATPMGGDDNDPSIGAISAFADLTVPKDNAPRVMTRDEIAEGWEDV